MKIYSSELLNTSQVNNGDISITTNDSIVIADANTDGTGGFQITGGTASTVVDVSATLLNDVTNLSLPYLDGRGQERNLNEFILADFDLTGNVLQLRNAAGEAIIGDITLPEAGGGSATAAETNPTNNLLPVKFQDNLGRNEFVDSIITEIGSLTAPVTALAAGPVAVTNTGSTLAISGVATGDATTQAAFLAAFGTATSTTILIDSVEYVGMLQALTAGTTATFMTTSPADFTGTNAVGANAAIVLPVTAGSRTTTGIQVGTSGARRNLAVTGNLEVQGTTTTVDSTTVEILDQFIQLATPSDPSVALTNRQSGFLSFVGTDGTTPNIQGIRYNATSNLWEVSTNATGVSLTSNVPDTDADWTAISSSTGTTNKAVVTIASITAATDLAAGAFGAVSGSFDGTAITDADEVTTSYAISSAAIITIDIEDVAGKQLPINDDDAIIQVYENNLQIIPDEISISGTTVTITLPFGYASTNPVKIVIIG